MMKIHLFNPEHDIALAANLSNFTAPHAGRQLRHDLGYLPSLWATDNDCVAVDDIDEAERGLRRLLDNMKRMGLTTPLGAAGRLIHIRRQVVLATCEAVEPWGWDKALRALLLRRGVLESVLPTEQQIDIIRLLSHRRTSAAVLPHLRFEDTVGESEDCRSVDEVNACVARWGNVVLKAPWSSSGRGLRFANMQSMTLHQGWLRNILEVQGSIMVEPYYNKVKDFGMEFVAKDDGRVDYCGLSLFHTANGAYTGNILATERWKEEQIRRYLPDTLMKNVREQLCVSLSQMFAGNYVGPLGVDMMVCRPSIPPPKEGGYIPLPPSSFLLHPCVEINLRRTMGHVALALSPSDDDVQRVMRMEYTDNHYKLKITRL